MAFVTLTKAQFVEWADKLHVEYLITQHVNGLEYVIAIPTQVGYLEIHISTSVDVRTGKTRDKGDDAIRITLYDVLAAKPVTAFRRGRVHRTEQATTVFERLTDAYNEALRVAHHIDKIGLCTKCDFPVHKVPRIQKKTGAQFYGCSRYPRCGESSQLVQAFNQYPLLDNSLCEAFVTSKIQQETAPSLPDTETLITPPTPAEREEPDANLITLPLVDESGRVPVDQYTQLAGLKFSHYNRLQSSVLTYELHQIPCNAVVATKTSTGKTTAAGMKAAEVIASGKMVVFTSPLKSLTDQQLRDFKAFWPDAEISIMSGDYALTEQRAAELQTADVLCITSEALNVRGRNYKSEKSSWISRIGLLIVDETHIIGSANRGPAVEVGIADIAELCPAADIWLLSATISNTTDMAKWLTALNGRPTVVLESGWRPTKLTTNLIQHQSGTYWDQQEAIKSIVKALCLHFRNDKVLVFVHTKNLGKSLRKILTSALGTEVPFHSADLSHEQRRAIESAFTDRQSDVNTIVSTPTLAWGVNTPARHVVIAGSKRGMDTVEVWDIEQMMGRAGRTGIDPEGFAHFICDNPKRWQQALRNLPPVKSGLLNRSNLGFHLLAAIKNLRVGCVADIYLWYKRTLAYQQGSLGTALVNETIEFLERLSMIEISAAGEITLRPLGDVSASFYFYPEDVFHWSVFGSAVDRESAWESDLAIAYLIGGVPTQQLGFVPSDEVERAEEYTQVLSNVFAAETKPKIDVRLFAADMFDCLQSRPSPVRLNKLREDVDRAAAALSWIAKLHNWAFNEWDVLTLRVRHGVSPTVAGLCRIPNIGPERAKTLYREYGIGSIQDALQNPQAISRVVGEKRARATLMAAQVLINNAA